MQKLSKRYINTPTSTPLACSNCDYALNSSEGRNSVHSLKISDNNSEEDQSQHVGSQNLRVSGIVHVYVFHFESLIYV